MGQSPFRVSEGGPGLRTAALVVISYDSLGLVQVPIRVGPNVIGMANLGSGIYLWRRPPLETAFSLVGDLTIALAAPVGK